MDETGRAIGEAAGQASIVAEANGASDTATITVAPVFASLSVGGFHSCGLTADGDVYCWGSGRSGQLGVGILRDTILPALTKGDLEFATVAAGFSHTCATTTENDAYCWGFNGTRQLGIGVNLPESCVGTICPEPALVFGFLAFSQVSASISHTCGLTTDSLAFCWGDGSLGALGDGTRASRTDPTAVAGNLKFKSISASGMRHTCALTGDGDAWCWGSIVDKGIPVLIPGGHKFESLSVGGSHACGLTEDGQAYCWGTNSLGQLGDGLTETQNEPVIVTGGLTFSSIAAGWNHTCGVAGDGTAYCWGRNLFGELGGSPTERCAETQCSTSPISVSGGLRFEGLEAGGAHTCGLTTRGTAYCWGYNALGQLGDGSRATSVNPVRVTKPERVLESTQDL